MKFDVQILSSILIIIGLLIFPIAIVKFRALLKSIYHTSKYKKWLILYYFTILFSVGYFLALILLTYKKLDYLLILLGIIFLGGAIFVAVISTLSNKTIKELISKETYNEYLKDTISTKDEIYKILDDRNKFIEEIISAIQYPFMVIDPKTHKIILANKSAIGDQKLGELTCHQVSHHRDTPCDGKEHECLISTVMMTKKPAHCEHLHFDPDGKEIYVLVNMAPAFDENNEIKYVLESSINITDRKNLELNLVDAYKKLYKIIDYLPVSVITTKKDDTIKLINKHALKMLGYTSYDKIYLMSIEDIFVKEYSDHTNEDQTFLKTIDGMKIPIEVIKQEINTDDGTKDLYAIVDLTKQHEVELAIKEASEIKSKFTSMVSHELRTPLTAIKEGIGIVLDGSAGNINEDQTMMLDTAKRNVDRLHRLINDVLDFTKLEAGRMDFNFADGKINSILSESVEMIKKSAESKGLQLNLILDDNIPEMKFDGDKLAQVIINLLSNAIKFTEKGTVTVTSKLNSKTDSVLLAVSDTGLGISQDNISRLFNEFQQVGDPNYRKTGSSGLGLAITREIIEAHNGEIWIESEIGKGSTFNINLPVNLIANNEEIKIKKSIQQKGKKYNKFYVFYIASDENNAHQDNFKIMLNNLSGRLEENGGIFIYRSSVEAFVGMPIREDKQEYMKFFKRLMKETIAFVAKDNKLNYKYNGAEYIHNSVNIKNFVQQLKEGTISVAENRLNSIIYIVDDENSILELAETYLTELKYKNIKSFNSGKQLLDELQNNLPDAIILDIKMPEMSGYEIIGRLKENDKTSEIPVVIMSGYAVEEEKLYKYNNKETIPIIKKPLSTETLDRIMRYVL